MSGTDVAKVRHLTVDELGERLNLDRWALYGLVRAKQIPALRIGRRIRFRLADVERWEAAGGAPARKAKAKAKAKRGRKEARR